MMSTVLHEKNGVITEDRFRNMTHIQWIFSYIQVSKEKKDDIELDIRKLKAGMSTIDRDLKMLMMVTDVGRGKQALEFIEKSDEEQKRLENGGEPEEEKKLSDEDQELWDFMQSTPETMSMPEKIQKERSFVVEAKSIDDLEDDIGFIGGVSNPSKENIVTYDETPQELPQDEQEDDKPKPMIIVNSSDDIEEGFSFDEY